MHRIWILTALVAIAFVNPEKASSQLMVVGNSVQEHEANPGEQYTGEIRILNQGSEPRAVRVYQTDYLFQADGTNDYSAPGSHSRSNAEWITVTPTDVVVPGGQATTITYGVVVPSTPGMAGTYWSMVMVEPTVVPTDAPAGPSEPAIGLRTTIRYGIQIATHVAGESEHRLSVENPQVVIDEVGTRHLQFELVNTGDIAYRPKVSLEMFDETGTLSMVLEVQRGLFYPGTSALQQFDISELPTGAYQAAVVVDTGSLEVFGAQFNLAIGPTN